MENFDTKNISEIHRILKEERDSTPRTTKAFGPVLVNHPCDVKISKESRKICAESITSNQ